MDTLPFRSRAGVGHEVRSDRMVPPPGAPTRTPPPTPDRHTVPVSTDTGPGRPVAPGVCVPHCGPIGPTTGQETDMASEVRGVVALAKGRPVSVVTIVVPDPGPGEAVVRSRPAACATPTCTTARAASTTTSRSCSATRRPAWWRRSGPTSPRSRPATSWFSTGGPCAASAGRAAGAARSTASPPTTPRQKMTLADGTPLSPALGIGAFADKTLVAAGQCTKVDPAARPEAVGLLGLRGHGRPRARPCSPVRSATGDSVAVFGCGGVGCAAVAGARLAGAATIIAVDLDARKLELAREFGATDVVDASTEDVVAAGAGAHRGQRRRRVHRGRRASRRCWSRPSTPATWPARWSRSACPRPTCASTCP